MFRQETKQCSSDSNIFFITPAPARDDSMLRANFHRKKHCMWLLDRRGIAFADVIFFQPILRKMCLCWSHPHALVTGDSARPCHLCYHPQMRLSAILSQIFTSFTSDNSLVLNVTTSPCCQISMFAGVRASVPSLRDEAGHLLMAPSCQPWNRMGRCGPHLRGAKNVIVRLCCESRAVGRAPVL